MSAWLWATIQLVGGDMGCCEMLGLRFATCDGRRKGGDNGLMSRRIETWCYYGKLTGMYRPCEVHKHGSNKQ